MASATLSAQERQRELAVLLEQTEAQNQQRGQCFHPLPCPFGSELSLQCPLTSDQITSDLFRPVFCRVNVILNPFLHHSLPVREMLLF